MVKVFSPGQAHGQWAAWIPVCLALVLTFALVGSERVLAQSPATTKPGAPSAAGKDAADAPQTKDEKKTDDQPPSEPPPDPSQTQKVSPVEIFKDPNAEDVLDVKKFNPIRNRPPDAR